jgi:hypothetical protein
VANNNSNDRPLLIALIGALAAILGAGIISYGYLRGGHGSGATPTVQSTTLPHSTSTVPSTTTEPITTMTTVTGSPPTTIATVPAAQQVISNCPPPPYYIETGQATLREPITVPAGQIAFIDAYSFDGFSSYVFVTVTGPYSGNDVITAGAICGGIPATADYGPVRQQRLGQHPNSTMVACGGSLGNTCKQVG